MEPPAVNFVLVSRRNLKLQFCGALEQRVSQMGAGHPGVGPMTARAAIVAAVARDATKQGPLFTPEPVGEQAVVLPCRKPQ